MRSQRFDKIQDQCGILQCTYFELFRDLSTETGSQFVATFDTDLRYLLTENLQLDADVNIGITQATDDFNPFVGLTMRF